MGSVFSLPLVGRVGVGFMLISQEMRDPHPAEALLRRPFPQGGGF